MAEETIVTNDITETVFDTPKSYGIKSVISNIKTEKTVEKKTDTKKSATSSLKKKVSAVKATANKKAIEAKKEDTKKTTTPITPVVSDKKEEDMKYKQEKVVDELPKVEKSVVIEEVKADEKSTEPEVKFTNDELHYIFKLISNGYHIKDILKKIKVFLKPSDDLFSKIENVKTTDELLAKIK